MQLSLMTLSMFIRILYHYYRNQDMEECRELYEEMMRTTSEAGVRMVELTSRETRLLGTDYVRSVLKEAKLTVGGYIHMDSLDDDADALIRAVETAASVHADILMLIPSWHTSLENLSRDEIHQIYAGRWMAAAQKAARQGIRVVVEDTPDQRLHLCRAEDMQHFLYLLPGVGLICDSGNVILAGEGPAGYARIFEGRIACVHLKDMKEVPAGTRGADCALDGRQMTSARHGTGVIPFEKVIHQLKTQGFDGRWVVELSMDGSENYLQAVNFAWSTARMLLQLD